MSAEDIYRLRSLSDPQMSPDGRWVACVLSQADRRQDRFLSDLWLIATDGRSKIQLTNRYHRDSSPRWAPDGRRIAFVAPAKDDDKAKPQLWVIPANGGEARQLTHLKQGVSSPIWSPDGRHLAFLARDPKPDDEADPKKPKLEVKDRRVYASDVKVTDRIRYRSTSYLPKEERRHIYLISSHGGRPRKLTDGDCDDSQPAWSPEGKLIAFDSNRGRDPDWDLVGDIWIVSAAGGSPRRLSSLPGGASAPAWSPDGRQIAYIGSPVPEVFRLEDRIWVQPATGGKKARSLTDSLDRWPHSPCWSPDGKSIYFGCFDEGFDSLWRTDVNGEIGRILPKERCLAGYSVAKQAGTIAFLHASPEHPADLFACDARGGKERRLTNLNQAALAGFAPAGTEPFVCRSFDGTPVHGWVVKPPGFKPGRKYPLILHAHGGPYWAFFHTWRFAAQVLASHGYIHVCANPRGSTGYGRKFQTAVVGKWGEKDSRDYLAALKHVVRQGYVDEGKIGIMGPSYGGFMTVWLLGTTDRFAAGVAECAATDEAMFYYSADMQLWSEQELGGPPWERPEEYRRVSASTHAAKIRAPLLLLHAEDDSRVPISHSEIVYTTVKRIGVEAVFARYPTGGHLFSASAPRFTCDTLNRTLDWFDRHLKGRGKSRR